MLAPESKKNINLWANILTQELCVPPKLEIRHRYSQCRQDLAGKSISGGNRSESDANVFKDAFHHSLTGLCSQPSFRWMICTFLFYSCVNPRYGCKNNVGAPNIKKCMISSAAGSIKSLGTEVGFPGWPVLRKLLQ